MSGETIEILKVDETTVRLNCDPSVFRELSEHFSFEVPGARWMPKVKAGLWDGKIRLLDWRTKTAPSGLVKEIESKAALSLYRTFRIPNENNELPLPQKVISDEVFKNRYIPHLRLSANFSSISPHDFQVESALFTLRERRSLIVSPTGSGKSLLIYLMYRWLLEENPELRLLLLVPTVGLVEQMYSDFADYAALDETWNPERHLAKVYSGQDKVAAGRTCIISTWQSLFRLEPEYFLQFDALVVDEVHLAEAKSISAIASACKRAEFRCGLSGTLRDSQAHELTLIGMFGPVYKTTTTKKLIEREILSEFSVKAFLLEHAERSAKLLEYFEEIDFLIDSERRNAFLVKLALKVDGNVLLLFQRTRHGRALFKALQKELGSAVYYIDGSVPAEERELIRRAVDSGEGKSVLVASAQTASTGMNIKDLHALIFASPMKAKVKVLQSIGRTLRKARNGQGSVLYDVLDDLRTERGENYAWRHGIERLRIYREEGFEVRYKKFAI